MSAGLPLVEELIPVPDPMEACGRLADLPYLVFLDSATTETPLASPRPARILQGQLPRRNPAPVTFSLASELLRDPNENMRWWAIQIGRAHV